MSARRCLPRRCSAQCAQCATLAARSGCHMDSPTPSPEACAWCPQVDRLAASTAADVVGTLSNASPEDQAVFSADSVEGKVRARKGSGCRI